MTQLSLDLRRKPSDIVERFFSLEGRRDVADLLEIPDKYLVHLLFLSKPKRTYRKFQIPKKASGMRVISAPHPALHILQSKLNDVLQEVYRRKPAAHGFVRGRSILTNALPHVGKRWVLNIDLEDFFPSINFGRVRGVFMARPYNVGPGAAAILARLCCNDNKLPQGAPTSPIVSNMVCARLDGELQQLAGKVKCTYTRYGDDITFSTRAWSFPQELAKTAGGWVGPYVRLAEPLLSVIDGNDFRVNGAKTRLQFRDCHQDVTGITVNRFPNVPRTLVREIRAMIHAWNKFGLEAAQRRFLEKYATRSRRPGADEPSFKRVLKGKLDYLQMIRGRDDRIYLKFRNQVHRLDPDLVSEAALPIATTETQTTQRVAISDPTWNHWFETYKRSVYHVEVKRENGDINAGTAFAYRPLLLATAAHNVVGKLTLNQPLPSSVSPSAVAFHPRAEEGYDLAVLRLSAGAVAHGRFLPIETKLPEIGESVAVLAYPTVPQRQPILGLYRGNVEAFPTDYSGKVQFIQVGVQLSGGMSGAPVINRAGQVVGVVVEQVFEDAQRGVPRRAFYQVLPARHVLEVDVEAATAIPWGPVTRLFQHLGHSFRKLTARIRRHPNA